MGLFGRKKTFNLERDCFFCRQPLREDNSEYQEVIALHQGFISLHPELVKQHPSETSYQVHEVTDPDSNQIIMRYIDLPNEIQGRLSMLFEEGHFTRGFIKINHHAECWDARRVWTQYPDYILVSRLRVFKNKYLKKLAAEEKKKQIA